MRFFGKAAPVLSDAQRRRLAAWQEQAPAVLELSHYQSRYVALQLGLEGLDPERHAISALAAVGLFQGAIRPTDAFWMTPDGNAAEAWLAWLEFVGQAPLVGFHLASVRPFLERALAASLGIEFRPVWLDLAVLLPELYREAGPTEATFAAWLEFFGLPPASAREPMQAALLLARLCQRVVQAARARGIDTPAALLEQLRARRWLHGEA